ncbi:unnamed protein product [Lymnaea stagnalis]|uniref:Proton-coupled folate transporter n=1 Tax=Lymnaea stagnalis TaxID=6523 RepID=A0AAV2IL35_LYMST
MSATESQSGVLERSEQFRGKTTMTTREDADRYLADEPLLTGDNTRKVHEDDEVEVDSTAGARNLSIALIILSLIMLSYSIFNDAFSQWIYVEFEMMVLGTNWSLANTSTANDPCIHGTNNTDPWTDQMNEAQALTSRFNVWSMLVSLLPAFCTNILLGAYSTRIGRRTLFIVPTFGLCARMAVNCIVAYWRLSVYWTFVGMGIAGITGHMPALFMAVYVYTADNTGHKRSRSFGMVVAQSTSLIFYSLSHIAVGYFIKAEGYLWPMLAATLINVLALCICGVFLKETLVTRTLGKRMSLVEGVKSVFVFYLIKTDNPRYKRKDFLMLGFVFFMYSTCLGVTIQSLYLMNEPLCWSSVKMGNVITFQGLLSAFASLVLMGLLQRFLTDEIICIISLGSGAASRFVLAFASYDWMIYVAYTIGLFELLLLPIIRAILSRIVSSEQRGSLFASIAVIEVATLAVAGAGLDALYSFTVDIWHGLTYFVIAICLVLAGTVMVAYILVISKREMSSNHGTDKATGKTADKIPDKTAESSYRSINVTANDEKLLHA